MTTRRLVNGATVKALREAVGITQTALAARVGLSGSSLSYLETKNRQVGVDRARRIADALGVPLDAISQTVQVEDKPVAA